MDSHIIPAELQRRALDAAQVMVREFDGTILHWSQGMEHLYGWQPLEVLGRNSHELLQTVFPQPLTDIEKKLVENGKWSGDLVRRHRDGRRVVVASHWSLWDQPACRVFEDDSDVTRERQEYDAKQYLASIIDSADDAIIGKTLEGVIRSWNRAAQTIFGYGAAEVIGKSITILFPRDRIEEEAVLLGRVRHGERVEHYETLRCRKDGVVIPVSLTISPILDADRKIIGASKIVRDISERRQALKKLQEVQSELFHVSRLNTISHMASGLAHELNQPLSAIANYLRGTQRLLSNEQDDLSVAVKEALARASEQAVRAGEVVKRLRNFLSRHDTEFKSESVSELVRETTALALFAVGPSNDVKVVFELDEGFDRVFIDRIQIQQVLLNLLRNACEAMDGAAWRELKIVTKAAASNMLEVSIIDTGSGISANAAAEIFIPFKSTKRQGMGVGLAISKTIVEVHGGKLWLEPNPDGGSIFKFTLPFLPPAENASR